jgi:serine/threonine protein kinase
MECLRTKFQNGVVLGGRYQTISPLNHGSFGMVFMARDLQTYQTVAIKCLTKRSAAYDAGVDFAIDDNSEELFCHRVLGSHANIVSMSDSFETDAHVYMVLEFCSRGDLYEAIRSGCGPLETEHVRQFMLELVESVDYMHSKGIYHRDIKPENIFLTESGSLKLGDFGLATTEKWSYESTVGSDRYMAPEQYDSAGAGYSPAQADIWAIGICLLNILFSRNPFTTPTEADPLFLDFSRDKQSLFDVFPTMSQDTYEVIVQCMSLDPSKRSLVGAKNALRRVVSFTTTEEEDDEFCSGERSVASANREPLRTPSIQSPQMDQGSFPWAKALQSSPPQAIRQLSVIPDNESYTEDLFPASEAAGTSWFSNHMDTPSMASVMDSYLGASILSLNLRKRQVPSLPRSDPVAITGSLPSHATKPLPSLSTVFGNNQGADKISKSWCDMWDEEESENEDLAMVQRREQNSRSWSHESQGAALPGLREPDSASPKQRSQESDEELKLDHFEIHRMSLDDDSDSSASSSTPRPLRNSPPEPSSADKWSMLGDVRRKYKPEDEPHKYKSRKSREVFSPKTVAVNTRRHDWGRGTSGYHQTKSKPASPLDARRRQLLEQQDWRSHVPKRFTPTYDGSVDDDLDLVGGWHETHF